MKSSRTIEPVNASRDFLINELFFSTTTKKGIIVSGNDVFARVSHYRIEDMVGKPHNLIRHPDMPRSVFKLFWDYLLAGKSIAAYVKNMASDGCYYWVVALATPIEREGFLSIRFKPSSQLFALISDIYTQLRTIEQEHERNGDGLKVGMQAAEEKLDELLQAKGFANYDAFMQALLYQELSSRDEILAREHRLMFPPLSTPRSEEGRLGSALREMYQKSNRTYQQINRVYAQLDEYVKHNQELSTHSSEILTLTRTFQLICINLTVASSRLANEGHTLTAISTHLREASSWIADIVSGLAKQTAQISFCLGETIFSLAWARLQFEMVIVETHEFLTLLANQEQTVKPSEQLIKLADLRFAFQQTIMRVENALQDLAVAVNGLNAEVGELRKALLSLQVTYVGGLVEAARLSNAGNFSTIFHEVDTHIADTKAKLGRFTHIISSLDNFARQAPEIVHIASNAGIQMGLDQEQLSALVNDHASPAVTPPPHLGNQRHKSTSTLSKAA